MGKENTMDPVEPLDQGDEHSATGMRPGVPAVRLRGVTVARGGRAVLRDVDLEIPSGQITGIIGPSGSGKSTMMRSIVGVQEGVTGTVEVLGEPAGVAARRGRVGYVTQDPAVYGDLTARENLTYFGRLLGVGNDRIEELIASVHLGDVAAQRVDDLSGGQRARVSLAVALLNQPPLLVLDEPTVGLDPVLRNELWSEFADLAATGRALLVSSHVMDEANRCDRLVLLRDGRVLAQGAPAELLERTGTDNVEAAFLSLVASGESS
jgi:ABC-2 type transport system ATP-binding protein